MFRFRLATLLKLRLAERDRRRAALAEAYRAERLLDQALDEADAETRQLESIARKASGPGSVDPDQMLAANRYRLALESRRRALADKRRQVAEETERRRAALAQAEQGVRVLEKLRERRLAAHRSGQLRDEAKRLDEAAAWKRVAEGSP